MDEESESSSESVVIASERLHSLTPASGWAVMMVDDLHGWREWQRLESRMRGRGGDEDAAALKRELIELQKTLEVEVRLVVSWAVRTRPDQDDEVVPLVPVETRLITADAVEGRLQVVKLLSFSWLDEDERRFLNRDGMFRRKLEWFAEKRIEA
jgi:hypothetical protein